MIDYNEYLCELDKRAKDSASFKNVKCYIGQYGTIGGINTKTDEEYILSLFTGELQKVNCGNGFDRNWRECSEEEFLQKQREIKDTIELTKKEKKTETDNVKIIIEPALESLEYKIGRDRRYYGKDDKGNIYRLERGVYTSCELISRKILTRCTKIKVYEAMEEKLRQFAYFNSDEYKEWVEKNKSKAPDYSYKDDYSFKQTFYSFNSFDKELRSLYLRSKEYHEKNSDKPFGTKFAFYESDIDFIYAIDENGNEYSVGSDKMVMMDRGRIDCMWGGVFPSEVMMLLRS